MNLTRWAALAMVPGEQLGARFLTKGHLSHKVSTLGNEPTTFRSQTKFFNYQTTRSCINIYIRGSVVNIKGH